MIFFFLSKRLRRGRNRRLKSQHFYLSKYQHNTEESPTSQPRINKGVLWQGRERKKRGEGDVRSFPSQKVPTETGDWEQSCPSDSSTQNWLLRLFPFRKEKKKKKEGETGCCQLDHRKLCNEIAVFFIPQGLQSRRLRSSKLLTPLKKKKKIISHNNRSSG